MRIDRETNYKLHSPGTFILVQETHKNRSSQVTSKEERVGTQRRGKRLSEDTGEGFIEKTLHLLLKDMQTFAK